MWRTLDKLLSQAGCFAGHCMIIAGAFATEDIGVLIMTAGAYLAWGSYQGIRLHRDIEDLEDDIEKMQRAVVSTRPTR